MSITTRSVVILSLLLVLTRFSFALIGTYNVGSGQTYTSLTGNGAAGFFNAVNSQGLTGNVTVNITSDINETGAVSLNQWTTAGFTITIRPSAGQIATLTGRNNQALCNINGADNLTIDGRFNGSGRYLRFVNTNSNGSTFTFSNDATFDTL